MFEVNWEKNFGWKKPFITPFHNFDMNPLNSTLHYGVSCFEGMRAFMGVDNIIRVFRPYDHFKRLNESINSLGL